MPSVQTVVVIIKFKSEVDIMHIRRPAGPFSRRQQLGVNITETQVIPLDRPLLLMPNGNADSIEVIPITDQTVIHGKDIKRVLK